MEIKKEIIHWIPNSNLGGCEILLQTFLQGENNYHHIIFTSKEGPAVELWQEYDVEIIYLFSWEKSNPLLWARELNKYLKKCNPNYFISWSPSRFPFLRWTLKNFPDLRYIVHIGSRISTSFVTFCQWTVLDIFFGLKKKDARMMLIGCSKYVDSSIKQDRYLKYFNSVGILNGVRKFFFDNICTLSTSTENLSLGTVGRLDAVKRHDKMIEMIKAITEKGYSPKLYLIGDGEEEKKLKKMAYDLGVNSNIIFRGRQFNIAEEFKNFQVFLFNSTELEGMGIALAEAMAMGCICVVNDSPLMREMLGNEGIFFSSNEEFVQQIEKLITNKYNIAEMSMLVKQRAKELFFPTVFFDNYRIYLMDKY